MSAQDKLIEARRLVGEVQREVTDPIGKASILCATSELNRVLAVLNHDLPDDGKIERDPFNCDIRR